MRKVRCLLIRCEGKERSGQAECYAVASRSQVSVRVARVVAGGERLQFSDFSLARLSQVYLGSLGDDQSTVRP
jgi:hypothetical protein